MEPAKRSCREIAAYDAARPNPHWTACLVEGEFAVRYFDPKTNCVVGADGKVLTPYTVSFITLRVLWCGSMFIPSASPN